MSHNFVFYYKNDLLLNNHKHIDSSLYFSRKVLNGMIWGVEW